MSEQNQIISNSKIMVGMTSISRVLGLVRDQLIAWLLGTSRWGDVWAVSFMLPNLFRRLIAEGAMSSAFVPIFSELTEREQHEEASAFMRAIFSLVMLVALLIVTVMILGLPILLPWVMRLTNPTGADVGEATFALLITPSRLMFPYLLFVSLAAICQGILNVNNRFALSAATPIFLNVFMISCGYFLRDWMGNPIWGLCTGVLLGGFCQFFLQWAHLYRLGFRVVPTLNFWGSRTREAVGLWLPSVFSGGIVQINALISTMVATNLLVGAAMAVSISNRLMELVLGVFAVAVSTSLLPVLSRQRSRGDRAAMEESLFGSLELMSLVAIPSAAGLILCGPSLLSLLFERGAFNRDSLDLTYAALIFHAMAIVPVCWYRIVIQTFYAHKQIKVTVYIASIGAFLNIACCLTLPSFMYFPHGGVAGATLISSWVLYLLCRQQISRRYHLRWPAELNRELLKICAATVAFIPVWLPFSPKVHNVGALLLRMSLSIVIYVAIVYLLRVRCFSRLLRKK